jgi:hypothetical protein
MKKECLTCEEVPAIIETGDKGEIKWELNS